MSSMCCCSFHSVQKAVHSKWVKMLSSITEKKVILYIHGKGGSHLEAEQYKENCSGFDMIGIDYNDYLPWIVQNQIQAANDNAHKIYDHSII